MTSFLSAALLVPLGCLAAVTAWADESSSRWSWGTQIGQARGGGDAAPPAGEPSTLSYDVSASLGEKNRFGWRVFTGFRFTDYLAVHVGYTDLGEVQSRLVDQSPPTQEFQYLDSVAARSIRGIDVSLQLKVPVNERVAVDLRGGKYYWQSRTHTTTSWHEDHLSTRRDSDVLFGAGIEIAMVDELSATIGWTRYEVGSELVDLWTVGALFRFSMY